jgi:hypothetical protein
MASRWADHHDWGDHQIPDSESDRIAYQHRGGPDRNVWFAKGGIVGRVTPDGVITEFSLSSPTAGGTGLTAGSDRQPPARLSNRLWVALSGDNSIGYLSFR